jgi:hypothetical protein
MITPHTHAAAYLRVLLPACLATGLLASWALAAPPAAPTEFQKAEARYKAERAACIEQRSNQDRETCLKEAGAVLAEARAAAARPSNPQAEPDYTANALARCERVPERDRADCRRMVQGQGSREGSVAEGAISYQLVTKSVGSVAGAASAP